jgi:hypothetical protein
MRGRREGARMNRKARRADARAGIAQIVSATAPVAREVRELGLGVRTLKDGERWRIEFQDVGRLRAAFGDDLLVAFARCFAVADRLITLHDMVRLIQTQTRHGSVRYLRNGMNIIVLAWAFTREMTEMIAALKQAGVEAFIQDRDAWVRLVELPDRWRGSGFQSDVRNRIGFHFDAELCREGLRVWSENPPTGERLTLAWGDGDGKREQDGALPMGHQLMMAGLGMLGPRALEDFAKDRLADPIGFPDALQRVFLDVLHAKMKAEAEGGRA